MEEVPNKHEKNEVIQRMIHREGSLTDAGVILVEGSEAHSHLDGRRPSPSGPHGLAEDRTPEKQESGQSGVNRGTVGTAFTCVVPLTKKKKKCNFQIPVGPPAPET